MTPHKLHSCITQDLHDVIPHRVSLYKHVEIQKYSSPYKDVNGSRRNRSSAVVLDTAEVEQAAEVEDAVALLDVLGVRVIL